MMINKKKFNIFVIFLLFHLAIWTLIPSISNVNLPLDTIEALAWGSNLDWGFDKHPPLSAVSVEIFYKLFGNQDWAYYLLSQIFVIIAFITVYKFSEEFFNNRQLALLSVLLLEGIYFYNFTTPEFNVNVSQLPFWALSIYFSWKCYNKDKLINNILLGLFIGLGILSKYLFIYLAIGIFFLFIYKILNEKKNKPKYYFIVGPMVLLILLPHLVWLVENDYTTISYGLQRSDGSGNFIDHLIYPIIFVGKQIGILIPFFLMLLFLVSKFKTKFNLKDKKFLFLLSINIIPIILIFMTSLTMGVKIRTMWMTPFYLFFGILFVYLYKEKANFKKINRFFVVFLFLFFLSPITYLYISISEKNKRTDYQGKEIARLVQNKWNENFRNEIKVVIGDEWYAGNLSYHLNSRPKWMNSLKDKISVIESDGGVIYAGNPKILEEICPGVFGTIKPVGYCMIGQK